MSNVIRLTPTPGNQKAIREKACYWVVRLHAGATEEELRAVHAWLDERPEHAKALLDAAYTWDQASVIAELSTVFPLKEYLSPRPSRLRYGVAGALAAAAVLLLCLQTSLLGRLWPDGHDARMDLQASYETRIGQQSTVVLPDGSVVLLNTNSQVRIDFSPEWRDIVLGRGEAHFTVAKDSSRPFRVHASGGIVEAVGTAFAVQESLLDGLEVTVVEGVVNFTPVRQAESEPSPAPSGNTASIRQEPAVAPPTPISLAAGESVQVKSVDEPIVKQTIQPDEMESKLAWRDGMVLFQGDPLEKVVRELSRYTAIRIDVDEDIRDMEVLAYFRTGNIEGVLLALSETLNLRVERISDDHVILLRSDN